MAQTPVRERTDREAGAVVALGLLAALLLAKGFDAPDGSAAFAGWTLGAIVCWLAGGLVVGVPLGSRRPGEPLAVALASFVVFAVGAVVVRVVPALHDSVGATLDRADALAVALPVALASAVAEEVWFRGALWRLLPSRPVLWSSVLYVVLTVASTRSASIALAAVVMGTVFGWQRARSGGIVAPVLTHVTWSLLVILLLPR